MSAAAASENMVGEGSSLAVSGRISLGDVLGAFRAATEEERAEFLFEMCISNTAFDARMKAARGVVVAEEKEVSEEATSTPVKEKKAAKAPAAPKKAAKEKKVVKGGARGFPLQAPNLHGNKGFWLWGRT